MAQQSFSPERKKADPHSIVFRLWVVTPARSSKMRNPVIGRLTENKLYLFDWKDRAVLKIPSCTSPMRTGPIFSSLRVRKKRGCNSREGRRMEIGSPHLSIRQAIGSFPKRFWSSMRKAKKKMAAL